MLFDSHAHVDSIKFDSDREFVINRALSSGVSLIMNPGADLESSKRSIELSNKYDFIYSAVGVHPHEAENMSEETLKILEEMTGNDKVKAIGEIGLDYYYDHSPRQVQKYWFKEQLLLAKRLKLPVIIHDRDANEDVLRILKEVNSFETGVLMHCFSGSLELARQYVKLGAYLSIAGPLTYKNARKTVEVVQNVSIDRLLIETDSPYLTPTPFRGKRNEPMYVRYTCEKMAELKKMSFDDVANITFNNAKEVFNIV
ncbi:TatD family hydrolase [Helicovermis profundi]|uniref:TatD family hydrolase n=1 Tax=Helicovermis profundi TaxID=3065157 RepID=A0AAU9E038_9FIRM|nr:TatD family hydrolase [Clostridia bacterium S502]